MTQRTQYSRHITGFRGIDVTSDDSNVGEARMPYAVNMWRDWESENGAAVETMPGYRQIPWTVEDGADGAEIHSLWTARFTVGESVKEFLVIHRGEDIAACESEARDAVRTLPVIGKVADRESKGFAFGEAFYILDGDSFYKLTRENEGFQLTALGDSADDIPETTAYIPTTYSDGKEYEQRNMLTNYFYNAYNVNNPEEVSYYNGLKLAVLSEEEKTLKVTGVFFGITHIYIPSETVWGGKTYKITTIEMGAFNNNAYIQSVVASEGVTTVNGGAFASCNKLETVVLHGVKTLGAIAFTRCPNLKRVILPKSLTTIGTNALQTGYEGKSWFYFEGSQSEADAIGLPEAIPEDAALTVDTALVEVAAGNTFRIPLDTAQYTNNRILGNYVSGAIEYVGEYEITDENKGVATGEEFKAIDRASWVGIAFTDDSGSSTKLAVVTVTKDGTAVSEQETSIASFRFDIYDPCREVISVTLDGEELEVEANGNELPMYYLLSETLGEKQYIRAVILTADKNKLYGKRLVIKGLAYDSEFTSSQAGKDFTYESGGYSGTSIDAIRKCTVFAEFDGRIFLTGNKHLPNTVFYSHRNLTGVNDPTYFGQLNYFNDGAGMTPNASLLSTPSFLAVIKADDGGGAIYYHTAEATEFDILPKIYPGVKGNAGIGSLGPCVNFRDDPVFLSKMGLEGISLSSVNSERGVYHRSTNVDKWLLQGTYPAQAVEWKGYLVILRNGEIFLADSRQFAKHETGGYQYEWYYLYDVGEYVGQSERFFFPSASPRYSDELLYTDLYHNGIRFEVKNEERFYEGTVKEANPSFDAAGTSGDGSVTVRYAEEVDAYGNLHYYIVDSDGEMHGGRFSPAVAVAEGSDVLYFGTNVGRIFVFNTDKRGEAVNGESVPSDKIHRSYYTHNGRRYLSGFSTKKDNCGMPHLDKDTVPRSLVIKSKTMTGSRYTLHVRTDREGWERVEMPTMTEANYFAEDFSNASFMTSDEVILPAREKKRRWVEKQYYFFSDGYCQPFGIYYITYRYTVSGLAGRIRR